MDGSFSEYTTNDLEQRLRAAYPGGTIPRAKKRESIAALYKHGMDEEAGERYFRMLDHIRDYLMVDPLYHWEIAQASHETILDAARTVSYALIQTFLTDIDTRGPGSLTELEDLFDARASDYRRMLEYVEIEPFN